MNHTDWIGRKVNNWNIVEYLGRNKSGKHIYNCKCECGTEEQVLDIYRLREGNVTKCRLAKKIALDESKIGMRIGKLTIIGLSEDNDYNKRESKKYVCKCDCGNEVEFLWTSLLRKECRTDSCGCDFLTRTHGKSKTRIYKIWDGMKYRCYKEGSQSWKHYGARGIKVCEEWLDKDNGFINFYNWSINNGYKEDLTIDRINVNGNYEPDNCRWITLKEQAVNKTDNRYIEYQGEVKALAEWADILGIKPITLGKRLDFGWSVEDALTKPVKSKEMNKLIYINGVGKTYKEWSKESGIKVDTLRSRYYKGLRGMDLLKKDMRGDIK